MSSILFRKFEQNSQRLERGRMAATFDDGRDGRRISPLSAAISRIRIRENVFCTVGYPGVVILVYCVDHHVRRCRLRRPAGELREET